MNAIRSIPSDVAFATSVKAVQMRKGSRQAYARMEKAMPWRTTITPDLARIIAASDQRLPGDSKCRRPALHPASWRAARLSARARRQDDRLRRFRRQPTIHHHRESADNPKVHLFLIDYAHRRRIKIWGEARVVEEDAELIGRLMPSDYKARAGQVILFTVSAWDANWPQYIPQRFDVADVAAALAERDERIAALEAKIRVLQQPTEDAQSPETARTAT